MTRRNHQSLLLAAVFTALGLGVVAIIYLGPTKSDQSIGQTVETENEDDFFDQSRYRLFEDELLGIQFEYPASWGELTTVLHAPDKEGTFRSEYVVLVEDVAFLNAVTAGDVPERDFWWGDIAKDAWSEADIRLWCDTMANRLNAYDQPRDICEILLNVNELAFVRLKGDVDYFGEVTQDVQVYVTNHPEHAFYGIALSTQDLLALEDELGNVDKAIKDIVNSFSFTE